MEVEQRRPVGVPHLRIATRRPDSVPTDPSMTDIPGLQRRYVGTSADCRHSENRPTTDSGSEAVTQMMIC